MHSLFSVIFRFLALLITIPILMTGAVTGVTIKSFLNRLIVREMDADMEIVQMTFEEYGKLWTIDNLPKAKADSFILRFLSVTQTVRIYDRNYNVLAVYGSDLPEDEERIRKEFNITVIPITTKLRGGPAFIEIYPSPEKLLGKQTFLKGLKFLFYAYLIILGCTLPLMQVFAYIGSKKITKSIAWMTTSLSELANGARNVEFPLPRLILETDQIAVAASNLQDQLIKKETTLVHRLQELTHDLKGPIAGLYNQLEAVELGAMELTQQRFNHFYRELGYLNKLIEDMSVLYELEDNLGGVELLEVETEQDLIIPLVERYKPLAGEKGIQLYSDVEVKTMTIDSVLMNRAIGNLIQNAILYGTGLVIDISVYKDDSEEIIIEVRNKGQISEEDLPHLFTRYWRKNQDRGGSGLGLPISRLIALKHKGDLSVENQKPDQVVFHFRFPPSLS